MTALQTAHTKMTAHTRMTAHTKMTAHARAGTTMLAQIRIRIQTSCYGEVRNVTVNLCGGELIIDGTVSSFHIKQIAQSILRDVEGIEKITNNLNVVYPDSAR